MVSFIGASLDAEGEEVEPWVVTHEQAVTRVPAVVDVSHLNTKLVINR